MTTLWQYSPEDAWLFGDDGIDDAAELALTPSVSGLSAAAFVQNEFFNSSDSIIGELDKDEGNDTLAATGTVADPPGGGSTLNLQVSASSSDSHQQSIANDAGRSPSGTGVCVLNAAVLSPGSHSSGNEWSVAAAFALNVAQGETISEAIFSMRANATYSAGSNVVKLYASVQDSDAPAALSSTSGDLNASNRPRTTATTILDVTSVTGGVWYEWDITPAVQELVDRAAWAANNLCVVLIDTHEDTTTTEWQDFDSYDGSPSGAPKLDVTHGGGGGGGITATLTGTEGDDTLAASVALSISGSVAATETNDTLAGAGALRISASLASTEADDALAATAGLRVTATLSATEADDTLSATGTIGSAPITGTLAVTEADDALSAAAALRIAASLAATEENDTLAATTALRISASLAVTEADDSFSAAVALRLSASLGVAEANDTLAASGALRIAGSLAATEADDTLTATGLIGNPPITATLAATEANDTLASTAGLRISAALSATEADDALAATAASRIGATLATTEADDTLSGTGTLRIAGGLAVVEADDILTAIAVVMLRGQLAATEADDTLSATAHLAGAVTRFVPLTLDDRDGALAVAERDKALALEARGVLLTVSKTHDRDLELSARGSGLKVRNR